MQSCFSAEPFHGPGGSHELEADFLKCRRAYYQAAANLDLEIGPLLSRLADDRRWTTHVVIVSDHGVSFSEHPAAYRRVREQMHVPLVILSSRLRMPVRRDVAGSIDVSRTVLSLAGVKYPRAPFSSARDLSAWAPDPSIDPQASAGLRIGALGFLDFPPRTDADPSERSRLPTASLFLAVDRGGRLFAGSADELTVRPSVSGPTAEDQARLLFEELAARVSPSGSPLGSQ